MEISQLCITVVSLLARSYARKAIFTTSLQLEVINSLIVRALLLHILHLFSHIIYKGTKYLPERASADQYETEALL